MVMTDCCIQLVTPSKVMTDCCIQLVTPSKWSRQGGLIHHLLPLAPEPLPLDPVQPPLAPVPHSIWRQAVQRVAVLFPWISSNTTQKRPTQYALQGGPVQGVLGALKSHGAGLQRPAKQPHIHMFHFVLFCFVLMGGSQLHVAATACC